MSVLTRATWHHIPEDGILHEGTSSLERLMSRWKDYIKTNLKEMGQSCHGPGSKMQTAHCGGLGSIQGQVMWYLWWTKWHWCRLSPSTSFSLVNSHSANYSTLSIIYI
jgi:hypothetical protein